MTLSKKKVTFLAKLPIFSGANKSPPMKTSRNALHDALVRLSDGDRSAFSVLVEGLWPIILLMAQRGLQHDQDAEDLAQEVFLKVCSRITDFDRSRDGLSWVFGIASYEILTQRKRLQRRRERPEVWLEGFSSSPLQEENVIRQGLLDALSVALGELSEPERVALGVSSGISEVQGTTLRKRKQRALERLKDVWRRLYGRP